MSKSRRKKWEWHATHLREMQRSGNMKGRYTCVELGADGWVTLSYTLQREGGKRWTGFIWFRILINDGLL